MKTEYQGKQYYAQSREDFENQGLPTDVIENVMASARWFEIRTQRDALLRASDYAIMPDYPLSDAQANEVREYRQALRDIPATFDNPDAVEWPEKPEVLA